MSPHFREARPRHRLHLQPRVPAAAAPERATLPLHLPGRPTLWSWTRSHLRIIPREDLYLNEGKRTELSVLLGLTDRQQPVWFCHIQMGHGRCLNAKGDDAGDCEKFAKDYRSLCPGEWVEKWNEQRENGRFPGPL